jgi:2-(1,2-epoxy-1,2-dihydrophenyl)acetyl-CoA isomerase
MNEQAQLIETYDSGVTTLTMNRPEARNAMTGEMVQALLAVLPRLAQDSAVRCIVLTGAGGAFCAGGDVKGFASGATEGGQPPSQEERIAGLRGGFEVSKMLHEIAKPTLAAIPGPAAGAGLSMALACDIRVALDSAKLTTAFAKVGLSGDYGVSYFLPYLVGQAKARELLFTAPVITGQQAYEYGLVNQVADAQRYDEMVSSTAAGLAAMPTVALGYMKGNLNAAYTGTLTQALDREAAGMARCFTTDDHKNAAKAFVEKRAPEFKGR